MTEKYDWPGWALDQNTHGKEFDLDARMRMVQGSRLLLPLLEKYQTRMGGAVLEAGPFFEPLVIPNSGRTVIYVDNDPHVVEYLMTKYPDAESIYGDFNQDEERLSKEIAKGNINLDAVVASQLLNYVDYRHFFDFVKRVLGSEGLLFVNHSTDYGLPAYFSAKRPKSNEEVLKELRKKGFIILEQEEIQSTNREVQPNSRLLVVGGKGEPDSGNGS